MNSRYLPQYFVLIFLSLNTVAQQPAYNQNSARSNNARAFNQNSSRSNHTRSVNTGNDWQFGINSGASFGINSNENSLFRGNGFTTGLNGHYFLGPLGLGVSSGFISSNLNSSAINQFIIDRKFPQTSTVTTTPAQNAFLMLGPSFRLGTKVQLLAGVKAGIFFNQGGGLIIGQQGALRPFYRFETGTKNIFPGFNGSISFSYPVNNSTAILLSTDYMRSASSVQLFDPQRGIDIPIEQKRNFQNINAGISFIKTFNVKSPRDAASGQATGKRSSETNDNGNQTTQRILKTKTKSNQSNDRVSTDSDDDGVSIIDPENKRVLKTKTKSNQSNDRTTNQSCGPVTLKTTKPDGTVEEQTFSCPDDAIQYQTKREGGTPNRISMNVTVPKQTQGATFGEKANQGMQSAGSHIIAGRISRAANDNGIITNRSKSDMASSGMHTNPGVQTNLYARESGSGMATGRRQYEPIYFDSDEQDTSLNAKLGQVKNNPLYKGPRGGANPLHKSGKRVGKEECDDGNLVFDVNLVDRNTGAIVASTKTNECGEYWFANVPDGNYAVALIGMWLSKKGYDYYQAKSNLRTDIAGEVMIPAETWSHIIYGSGSGKVSVQDLSIVVADTDGDGMAEVFRANGTLTDGTVHDFTQSAAAKGGGSGKVSMQDFHFTMSASNQRSSGGSGKVSVQDIHFTKRTGYSAYQAIATFSDGTTQDVSEHVVIKQSGDVVQVSLQLGDVDGDGLSDLIWSPQSNFGVSAQSAKVNVQDFSITKRTNIFTKNLPVSIGDVDGNGSSELHVGSIANPTIGIISGRTKVTGFENGDISNEDDYSFAKPGNPIKGIIVKGGKNPGGDTSRMRTIPGNNNPYQPDFPLAIPGNPIGGLTIKGGKNPGGLTQQRTTNSLGEFEFSNLEPGNYQFVVEATYIINDITDLDLDEEGTTLYTQKGVVKITASQNSQSLRINQTTGGTGNTKAQDYNSSRSNKTASIATFNDLTEVLNELDQQLQKDDMPQNKAGVSTSRSNVRTLRSTIVSIQADLENNNLDEAKQKINSMNLQFLALQQSLQKMGSRYIAISNVLKTKHDTAKNSIQNIR